MLLSDFLSRQKTDNSNLHEIIPLSFSLKRVLLENYYRLNDLTETDKYLVQIRSHKRLSGTKVPEVHGVDRGLILQVKTEHQKSVVAPTTCLTPPMHHTRPTHQKQTKGQGPPQITMPPIP